MYLDIQCNFGLGLSFSTQSLILLLLPALFVSIDLYAAGLAHNCPAIPVESVFVLGVVFVS